VTRLAILLAVLLLTACAGGDDEDSELVVFAASSLSGVAKQLDPNATVVLGDSDELAARIRDGAEADVFLSEGAKPLAALRTDELVEPPVAFASNSLVIVAPRANRKQVNHIVDLTRKGVRLALGAEGVPVGDYARESLELAGLGAALDNVVSLEQGVDGVVAKVKRADADAGIVFTTDALALGDDVRSFSISPYFQPEIGYYAAAVSPSSDRASAYVERLAGSGAQAALSRAGFFPAPS
jgi:molybdate transport system substrate-binding protein